MTALYKKVLSCFLCVLLVLWMSVMPGGAAEPRSHAEITAQIDDFVRESMTVNHIPGASLAITMGDEVFYTQGYGSYAGTREITPVTPFPLASLSKPITAVAVLQLAEQGLIDLDAPYVSYFTDIRPADERVHRITIRHLLNQTSGLNDKVNPDMTRSVPFTGLQEINVSLNTVQLASEPGSTYSYHNPNYQFLSNLVERISGQRFAVYLEEHIFEPLGMKNTYSVSHTQQIGENPEMPEGHYLLLGVPVRQAEPYWFIDGPAGVISTAEDMVKWMLAQQDDSPLLSPEWMKIYQAAGQISPYGMGWLTGEDAGTGRTISHSGIFWTYKAEEKVYLDRQLGIAMMFNSGLNAFVDYAAFMDGVARIIQGEEVEISIMNSRTMEAGSLLLIMATMLRGGCLLYRLRRSQEEITTGRLVLSTLWRVLPILILLFLPALTSFIGGGRVLPWSGLWTTLSSLVVWLFLLSLINTGIMIGRIRLYCTSRRLFVKKG